VGPGKKNNLRVNQIRPKNEDCGVANILVVEKTERRKTALSRTIQKKDFRYGRSLKQQRETKLASPHRKKQKDSGTRAGAKDAEEKKKPNQVRHRPDPQCL